MASSRNWLVGVRQGFHILENGFGGMELQRQWLTLAQNRELLLICRVGHWLFLTVVAFLAVFASRRDGCVPAEGRCAQQHDD